MNKKIHDLLFDDSNIYAIGALMNYTFYALLLTAGFCASVKIYNLLTNDTPKDNKKPETETEIDYQNPKIEDAILLSDLPVIQDDERYYVDIPEGYEIQEVNGEMMAVKIEKEDTLKLKLTK